MRKTHRMLRIRGALLAAVVVGMLGGVTTSAVASTQDSGGGGSLGSSSIADVSVSQTVECSTLAAQIRSLDGGLCR